jgi:hypothetical protein
MGSFTKGGQPALGNRSRAADVGIRAARRSDKMSRADVPAVERIIANTINETARASGVNAGREWSEAELKELGNMLLRGVPIEEIARVLRRDNREVRDKVAEVGRACR